MTTTVYTVDIFHAPKARIVKGFLTKTDAAWFADAAREDSMGRARVVVGTADLSDEQAARFTDGCDLLGIGVQV